MPWDQRQTPRTPLPAAVRQRILRRDGRVCYLCGHDDADQVDHIVPVMDGGTDDDANLASIHGGHCPHCGRRCHGDKTAAESARARRAYYATAKHPRPRKHPGRV
jgi:5-methylcytosine-specific restriction endonuclease McrA